jgi:hypothetical protein
MMISAPALADERSFQIYGFAQGDYIQDTKRVDPAWEDAFRPSKISVNGEFGTNGQASVSVKQSRFGVKGTMPTAEGFPALKFKFEFDFFGVGVDEGQTTVRLRHFYGEWGPILAGQTHSLFMDIDVFPNVIDYWGPSGMVFLRTPQLRLTPYRTETSEFAIAIEKPLNDIDPGNIRLIEEFALANVLNDEKAPDLTTHFKYGADWGHVQIAGIVRRVGYEYQVTPTGIFSANKQIGWGVNASSVLNALERDRALLQVVYGRGIASYMNDGGMDIAPNAAFNPGSPTPTLSAEAVPLLGMEAYYDHYWTKKWSTSLGYSFTKVSNTSFQEPVAFHRGQYASINLLAYPADELMFGIEMLWGKRTNNNGDSGDDLRFQVSAKYTFGIDL